MLLLDFVSSSCHNSRIYSILGKIGDRYIRKKRGRNEWEIVDKRVIALKVEETLQLFL